MTKDGAYPGGPFGLAKDIVDLTFAVHDGHRTDWDSRIHCHARTLRGIRCMNKKIEKKKTCKRHKGKAK